MQTITFEPPLAAPVGINQANWRSRALGACLKFAQDYKATNARFSFSREENFYVTLDFAGPTITAMNDGAREALKSRVEALLIALTGFTSGPVTIASGTLFLTCTNNLIAFKTMPESSMQSTTVVAFGFLLAETNTVDTEECWDQIMMRVLQVSYLPDLKVHGYEPDTSIKVRTLPTSFGELHLQESAFSSSSVETINRYQGIAVLSRSDEITKKFKLLSVLDSPHPEPDLTKLTSALQTDPAQFAALGPVRLWVMNNRNYTKWLEHSLRLISADPKKNRHLKAHGLDQLVDIQPELTVISAKKYPTNFLINIYQDSSTKFLMKKLLTEANASRAHMWTEACVHILRLAIANDLIPNLTEDNKLKLPLRYNQVPIFFGFNVSHNACAYRADRSTGRIVFMANPKVLSLEKTSEVGLSLMAASLVASLPEMSVHAHQRLHMDLVNLLLEES